MDTRREKCGCVSMPSRLVVDRFDLLIYFVLLFCIGLRKVCPYYFTFTTFTKGRWVGEKILDVFAKEFRAHPVEEYVSNFWFVVIKVVFFFFSLIWNVKRFVLLLLFYCQRQDSLLTGGNWNKFKLVMSRSLRVMYTPFHLSVRLSIPLKRWGNKRRHSSWR